MINHPNRSKRAISAVPSIKRTRAPAHDHDADWASFISGVRGTFVRRVGNRPVFQTNAEGLNDIYLKHLGSEKRIHNCAACRHFINRYGGLVTISADGNVEPAMWDPDRVPKFYRKAVALMAAKVFSARVTGPFLSADFSWGTPLTGSWTHLAVDNGQRYTKKALTAGQAMAAQRADYETVERALAEFPPKVLNEAARLLEAEHLVRSEKFIAPVHWLIDLQVRRQAAMDHCRRENILWQAIATAPEGFCHPRASVIGSLLEDLQAGLPFDSVKKRFSEKLGPLQYQRPQAPPAAGNIKRAEDLFQKLGLAPALERRFARLDEIQTAWAPFIPKKRPAPRGGVFSHLAPKRSDREVRAAGTPEAVMTWEKFCRTVLPGAETIEVHVHGTMNFIALTTAVHEDAPPVMKWDSEKERNPVAWYVYHNGSHAETWGLKTGWTKVNAIASLPTMWGEKPQPHLGEGFVLILDGCADRRIAQGNALFPECLKAELHSVRSTIEAYSRSAGLTGHAEASACGLDIRKGATNLGYRLRVTAGGLQTDYRLDRWD